MSEHDGKVICTTCNGAGKVSVEVHTYGEKERSKVELQCVICNGAGEITAETAAALKRHEDDWCRCGNPSGDATFYNDGEHPNCHKHHYRCVDCNGIVQIG